MRSRSDGNHFVDRHNTRRDERSRADTQHGESSRHRADGDKREDRGVEQGGHIEKLVKRSCGDESKNDDNPGAGPGEETGQQAETVHGHSQRQGQGQGQDQEKREMSSKATSQMEEPEADGFDLLSSILGDDMAAPPTPEKAGMSPAKRQRTE